MRRIRPERYGCRQHRQDRRATGELRDDEVRRDLVGAVKSVALINATCVAALTVANSTTLATPDASVVTVCDDTITAPDGSWMP
jgi:hypothetical protein